jgi:hypothetical protein
MHFWYNIYWVYTFKVSDIFTTYRVSFQEAIEHEKTQHISRVIGSEILKANGGKSRIIEHTIQNKDGSQECTTYFKSIDPVKDLLAVYRLYICEQAHRQVSF